MRLLLLLPVGGQVGVRGSEDDGSVFPPADVLGLAHPSWG